MTDRILVALDHSEPAQAALKEALTRFTADQLVVLHVLDTSEASHGMEGGAAGGWFEAKQEEAETLLEEARTTAAEHGVTLETEIETGRPASVILDYVDDHGIDHVVMGSHGRSGLSRIIVGSVAEEVIRKSPVSVTVARDRR